MRRIGDLVLGAAVIGLLSMSTGCVKKSEAGLDAKTAAVNGGGIATRSRVKAMVRESPACLGSL